MGKIQFEVGIGSELNEQDLNRLHHAEIERLSKVLDDAKKGDKEAEIIVHCLGSIFKIFMGKAVELLDKNNGMTNNEAQLAFVYAAAQYATLGIEVLLDKDILNQHECPHSDDE